MIAACRVFTVLGPLRGLGRYSCRRRDRVLRVCPRAHNSQVAVTCCTQYLARGPTSLPRPKRTDNFPPRSPGAADLPLQDLGVSTVTGAHAPAARVSPDADCDPGSVIGLAVVISAGQPYVAVGVDVRRVCRTVVCSPEFRLGTQHIGLHQLGDLCGSAARCLPRRRRLLRLLRRPDLSAQLLIQQAAALDDNHHFGWSPKLWNRLPKPFFVTKFRTLGFRR